MRYLIGGMLPVCFFITLCVLCIFISTLSHINVEAVEIVGRSKLKCDHFIAAVFVNGHDSLLCQLSAVASPEPLTNLVNG